MKKEDKESLRRGYEKLKEILKEYHKGKRRIPLVIKILLVLAVPFQIFFPNIITTAMIKIFVVLLIFIVILIFLVSKGLPEVIPWGNINFLTLASVFMIIFYSLLLTSFLNCGKVSCYELLSSRRGTIFTLSFFLVTVIIGLVFSVILDGTIFIVFLFIYSTIVFISVPFLAQSTSYYKLCSSIPLISTSPLCPSREVKIDKMKTVTIPVKGGISVNWEGFPDTIYAGYPFSFPFTIKNLYDGNIALSSIDVYLLTSYKGWLKWKCPYSVKTNTIKEGGFYSDYVKILPDEISVEENNLCPYKEIQIAKVTGVDREDIECAYDKPCENEKNVCIRSGPFECECVNFTKVMCNKPAVFVQLVITHSGFFRAVANLSYSEKLMRPKPAFKFTQGPLSVTVELLPNPYIPSIHDYTSEVLLFVTFENKGGGDILIKNFKVEPINTVIHTIDRLSGKEVIEEVGVTIKSCKSLEEILPEGKLPSDKSAGGLLCILSKPIVKTKIVDLDTKEVVEISGTTFSKIYQYCKFQDTGKEENYYENEECSSSCITRGYSGGVCSLGEPNGGCTKDGKAFVYEKNDEDSCEDGYECYCKKIFECGTNRVCVNGKCVPKGAENIVRQIYKTTNWENIYKAVEKTGLCEAIEERERGKNEDLEKSVEKALAYTNIAIEFSYTREALFRSPKVTPYTRTPACMELTGSY